MVLMSKLVQANFDSLQLDHKANLFALHHKLNILASMLHFDPTITSGYRTWDDHLRIYAQKRLRDPSLKIPDNSLHLWGAACDLSDSGSLVKKAILDGLEVVEKLDLYFEDFDYTHGWVHVQIYPPKSGKRFFQP